MDWYWTPYNLLPEIMLTKSIMTQCVTCSYWFNSSRHPLKQPQHDDVIKWKHFPRNWPFVRGIHRSPVNFPHKGHWRGALMFSPICVWIYSWISNREAGDLRSYRAHYEVIEMKWLILVFRQDSLKKNDLHETYGNKDHIVWVCKVVKW